MTRHSYVFREWLVASHCGSGWWQLFSHRATVTLLQWENSKAKGTPTMATPRRQQRANKSLHPTACSSVRSSLRFQQRVSCVVVWARLHFNVLNSESWKFFVRCSCPAGKIQALLRNIEYSIRGAISIQVLLLHGTSQFVQQILARPTSCLRGVV